MLPSIQAARPLTPPASLEGAARPTPPAHQRDAVAVDAFDAADSASPEAQSSIPTVHIRDALLHTQTGAHLPLIPRNIGEQCPITFDPIDEIDNAIFAEDGYVYTRTALMAAMSMSVSSRSPMTGVNMPITGEELFGGIPLSPLSIDHAQLKLWGSGIVIYANIVGLFICSQMAPPAKKDLDAFETIAYHPCWLPLLGAALSMNVKTAISTIRHIQELYRGREQFLEAAL